MVRGFAFVFAGAAVAVGCTSSHSSVGPGSAGAGAAPSATAPAGTAAAAGPDDTAGTAAPIDTSLHTYDADDPNIQYSGRIDWTDPKTPTYSAPGVAVSVHFRGQSVSASLGDEFRYGSERGFHDIVVDGQIAGKLALVPGTDKYPLATDLPLGEHTVSIVKRTQASLGKAMFRGFEIAGEIAPSPAPPSLRIEFIGDSITAGEGVEGVNGSADCSQNANGQAGGWGQPFHNADRSYGVVAAHELNAEYHLTAVSGIGLVRDYSQMYDARTMADVYDLLFVEETASSPWDPAKFQPDIVVVALGTNDFSPGDAPRPPMDVAAYTTAYVNFLTKLRAEYPSAELFGLTSQLLSDGYPAGTTSATDLKTAITNAIQQLNDAGDPAIHFFETTHVQGQACSGHPNIDQQTQLGQELAAHLRATLHL